MKAFSQLNKVVVAALACLMLAGSISAFAVPQSQMKRVLFNQKFTGKCCFMWGETVQVTEPKAVAPVIVTWSTDYNDTNEWVVAGLRVNGRQCTFYGPVSFALYTATDTAVTVTHQWEIFPSDGLKAGANTFQLCGGGAFTNGAHITIGFNTLAVQISK